MTDLLERAFSEAAKLPREAQDMLARMLLDDLAAEREWDATLSLSSDLLARLSDEAVAETALDDASFAEKFHRLADQWRTETALSSDLTQKLSHPAYLRIMAMGERVLPLILRDLEARGGHWFMALKYIVDENENPVPREHYAKVKQMTEDWLAWGRRKRLL